MQKKELTVGIYTLGCKVNQYESEAIAEALESHGFTVLNHNDKCDIYIINTCTVTAESTKTASKTEKKMVLQDRLRAVLFLS